MKAAASAAGRSQVWQFTISTIPPPPPLLFSTPLSHFGGDGADDDVQEAWETRSLSDVRVSGETSQLARPSGNKIRSCANTKCTFLSDAYDPDGAKVLSRH